MAEVGLMNGGRLWRLQTAEGGTLELSKPEAHLNLRLEPGDQRYSVLAIEAVDSHGNGTGRPVPLTRREAGALVSALQIALAEFDERDM
jgi:hypothetical protein